MRQNSCCGSSVRPARATSISTRYDPAHEAEQQSQRAVDAPQARDLRDSLSSAESTLETSSTAATTSSEREQPLRQRAARPVRRNIRHHHADELPGNEKRRDPADQPEYLGQQAAPHAAQWRKTDHRHYSVVEGSEHRSLTVADALFAPGVASPASRTFTMRRRCRRSGQRTGRRATTCAWSRRLACDVRYMRALPPLSTSSPSSARRLSSSKVPSCTTKRLPGGEDGVPESRRALLAFSCSRLVLGVRVGVAALESRGRRFGVLTCDSGRRRARLGFRLGLALALSVRGLACAVVSAGFVACGLVSASPDARRRRCPTRRPDHPARRRLACRVGGALLLGFAGGAGRFGMSMAMSSVTGFGCESSTIGRMITAATHQRNRADEAAARALLFRQAWGRAASRRRRGTLRAAGPAFRATVRRGPREESVFAPRRVGASSFLPNEKIPMNGLVREA